MDLSTGFSPHILRNFLDFFQSTHRQILLFLLDQYEIFPILSKQLQFFSYYIATVAVVQSYESNNHTDILSK